MAQQAFYTKINASAGVQFSGGTIAQATAVLHTNNILYFRGGSSGLVLSNYDGSEGVVILNDHIKIETAAVERLRVTSTGNVGIGTSTPTANLYVSGSNADATDKPTMISESVFTVKPVALNSGNLNFAQVNSGNAIGMQYTNGTGTADWDISMQPFGGNVGIGISSPNRSLHVIGQVAIDNSTSPSGGLLVSPDGTSNKVYSRTGNATSSAHPLDFISGSSTSMRIATTGNVGIGTTSPANKLEVAGGGVRAPYFTSIGGRSFKMDNIAFVGGYSDGSDANGANDLGSATNQWKDLYLSGDITSSAGGATFAGDVTISNASPTLNLTDTDNSSNISLSSVGGALIVNSTSDQVYQIGGTEYFRVAASGATFAGNVTATNILTVAGAATGSPYLQFTQGGTQKAYIQYVDSGDSFELQSDNQFVVRTGGSTAALTINSSQNATFANDVGMVTGHSSGKFAVMSTAVHGSYDFYNNGTSYFNSAVTVDDNLSVTSGNATFAGNVNAGTGLRMYTDGSGKGVIYNLGQDKDLYFVGDDGGTGINALVLDMSEGGNATFAGNVTLNSRLTFDYGGDHYFEAGTNSLSYKSSGGSSIMSLNASTSAATFAGKVNVAGSTNNESALNVLTQNGSIGSIGFETGSEVTGIISSATELMEFRVGDGVGISSAKQLKIDTGGIEVTGDAEITNSSNGLILKSPDGTRYRVTVANGGTLSVSAV